MQPERAAASAINGATGKCRNVDGVIQGARPRRFATEILIFQSQPLFIQPVCKFPVCSVTPTGVNNKTTVHCLQASDLMTVVLNVLANTEAGHQLERMGVSLENLHEWYVVPATSETTGISYWSSGLPGGHTTVGR